MSMYLCPQCGTNTYNTPTGWRHHNTGTEACYEPTAVEVDEDEPAEDDEQRLGWRQW